MLREKIEQKNSNNWFSFWNKEERNTWLAKFLRMNELKDQVCSSWFAPVGSASDYPLLSKWVIYGEVLKTSTRFIQSCVLNHISMSGPILWCTSVTSLAPRTKLFPAVDQYVLPLDQM
jgi:hypothetical protein